MFSRLVTSFKGKGIKTRLKKPIDTFLDFKLGITTWGSWESTVTDGMAYEPASYRALKKALDKVEISKEDVFFDLGCGLARPLFYADYLYQPKACVGVEANSLLVDMANSNIASYHYNKHRITVVKALAQDVDYAEATIIYMYNPFNKKTVAEVMGRIKQSIIDNPRQVKIVYLNPIDDQVLRDCDWLENTGNIVHDDIRELRVGKNQKIAVTYYRSII